MSFYFHKGAGACLCNAPLVRISSALCLNVFSHENAAMLSEAAGPPESISRTGKHRDNAAALCLAGRAETPPWRCGYAHERSSPRRKSHRRKRRRGNGGGNRDGRRQSKECLGNQKCIAPQNSEQVCWKGFGMERRRRNERKKREKNRKTREREIGEC
jgi:hypothetical protein